MLCASDADLLYCLSVKEKRIHIATSVATLILLALGCGVGGSTTSGAEPPVGLMTATPGGRISVSLLTATVTPGPGEMTAVPLQSTLIGPVATVTAAAATAVAQTATAAAPTPTVPGVFTEPAVCPSPGNPALPGRPPTFAQYPEVIVQYLSAGGPPTILEATLRGWGGITETMGLVRADRDFTGDGVPEVFMVVGDPQHAEMVPQPGDLYIFGCEEGAYRLLFQVGYTLERGAPRIVSADDINGNFLNDLVYVVEECDERVCVGQVRLVQWSLTLGNFVDLAHDEIAVPYPDVYVADVDEDGLGEVIVTNGASPEPEAGPQRIVTQVWHWDGALYVLSETIAPETPYRIHVIYDGDAALETGNYEEALEYYGRAIEDDTLLNWTLPNEREYLTAYALYREVLVYAAQSDVEMAQAILDRLSAEFPVEEGEERPGSVFTSLARVFWGDFAINRNPVLACNLTVVSAQTRPDALSVLNSFGYANRRYTARDLCPLGE